MNERGAHDIVCPGGPYCDDLKEERNVTYKEVGTTEDGDTKRHKASSTVTQQSAS